MKTYNTAQEVIDALNKQTTTPLQNAKAIFFKRQPGQYAQHDQFIGVTVPAIRIIAKQARTLPLDQIEILINSRINEIRLCALIIMVDQYKKSDASQKQTVYNFFMSHRGQVNNWNLVDVAAPDIVGAHTLAHGDKETLERLAQSSNLWERRIAMVSTLYCIRHNSYTYTIAIATLLLHDTHDLIHKAVGWMLREMRKKELQPLLAFLDVHAHHMPRTALRYAIEKLSKSEQLHYLQQKEIRKQHL